MILGRALRARFPLDPGLVYLNHGGFGVTPIDVLEAQRAIRDRIERNPGRFLESELHDALVGSLASVAPLLGASADDLVFVDNATTGVNAALRAVALSPGDVVVATDHGYPGVRNAIRDRCARTGATFREVALPVPIDADGVVAAVTDALDDRVRLLVIDHISSASAVVMPVCRLVTAGRAVGARVLVDGAHAVGQLALDVPSLGADWWVGNVHKWGYAPRGTAVLWAAEDARGGLQPPVISLGYDAGWRDAFHWPGTRDFSAWLACPAAVAFAGSVGGHEAIRAYTHDLQRWAVTTLCDAWGVAAPVPSAMRAAMATLPIPTGEDATTLRARLREVHHIEVPVFCHADRMWLRIGVGPYVDRQDIARLAAAFG